MAIALARSGLPIDLVERHKLERRIHDRGGEREIQFFYRDRAPRLPVWRDGRLQIVRWGNGRGSSKLLPRTGWTWQSSIDGGMWRNLDTVAVDIPATLGFEHGVWYVIHEGIRGLLVPDERGIAVVYMICEPSSHYYRIMTGSDRMPIFIAQRI
jgi:hypothetical protein